MTTLNVTLNITAQNGAEGANHGFQPDDLALSLTGSGVHSDTVTLPAATDTTLDGYSFSTAGAFFIKNLDDTDSITIRYGAQDGPVLGPGEFIFITGSNDPDARPVANTPKVFYKVWEA